VFPGLATGGFGNGVASFDGTYKAALIGGEGFEPLGVADVDGDGRADLISLHTNGTAHVHAGSADGTFGARAESFAGTMKTSLFGAVGHEPFAALDIDGNGRADLITATTAGSLGVYPGQADRTFAARVESFDGVLTLRTTPRGFEPVSERPIVRRLGCAATGCY
jgi:hypothetical protein